MRSTYWWGIPTLLAAPHDPDPAGCDIALVGVPHSSGNGSTERDQHLGPRAVRHVSAGYRRRHRRFGIVPHELCRLRDLGGVVAAIAERIGDRPIYVSFDLDCLDPSVAPAVSNLEPGEDGFTMSEASRILQGLRGRELVGGDVVCLMPTKDNPNGITAMNAAAVLFELAALAAESVAAAA